MSNCKECEHFIFEIAEVTPSHEDVLVCACLKKDGYLKDLAPCESFEEVEGMNIEEEQYVMRKIKDFGD